MAGSEATLQGQVRDLALRFGWLYFHDADARRDDAGFPDVVVVHPVWGRLIWAELKSARGRLSPEQTDWLAALRKAGQEVYVWRPSDLPAITELLSNGRAYLT